MRVNTELDGEKVPENKSCPPSSLAFCKVNYLPQGQIFHIYIYIYITVILRGRAGYELIYI